MHGNTRSVSGVSPDLGKAVCQETMVIVEFCTGLTFILLRSAEFDNIGNTIWERYNHSQELGTRYVAMKH
jgi:hypothetical protein